MPVLEGPPLNGNQQRSEVSYLDNNVMKLQLAILVMHYGIHSSKRYWLLQLSAEALSNSICTAHTTAGWQQQHQGAAHSVKVLVLVASRETTAATCSGFGLSLLPHSHWSPCAWVNGSDKHLQMSSRRRLLCRVKAPGNIHLAAAPSAANHVRLEATCHMPAAHTPSSATTASRTGHQWVLKTWPQSLQPHWSVADTAAHQLPPLPGLLRI